MANSQEIAILDFTVGVRGFSAVDSLAFLCAFAPLREHIPFWENISR